jgi:UDP-glucose 4-epimerase
MRALVTGGAGFIGRHLVNNLISEKYEVIVLDSGHTGLLDQVNKNAKLIKIEIDRCEINDFKRHLDGVDIVFHLAAQKHNTLNVPTEKIISTNIAATYNLAVASGEANVKRLVFTSSLYAYGNLGPSIMRESDIPIPSTLYGGSKILGEHILRFAEKEFGLSWNVARLFFIYGPGQFAGSGYKSVIIKNFERIRDGLSVIINGDGKQSLDYVYVKDAVDALKLLANGKIQNSTFNVSSGRSISIIDLLEKMEETSGHKSKRIFEPGDWTLGTKRFGDNQLIQSQLEWSPKTTLDEGLSATWNFVKNEKYLAAR